jgi:hypothetical protein
MVNGYLHMEVDSGATDFDVFSFSYDELRTLGIFQIATMDILMNIINEEWITEETHSIQVKSDAADTYEEDPQAYYNAITSQKAQNQLEYKVIVNEDIREELGTDLYLESKVFMKSRYGEYLKMEVVNEGSQMRYVRIGTEMVNGMPANSASEYFTIFPGKKAVFSIDMEWALPKTLREAFEMDEIATAVIFADMYNCTENGSMDWNDDGEYKDMNFTVPGVTAAPNMSGTVVYEENGLKITAKAPVVDVFSDEYREAYVYLIFENVGDMDLYLRESDEKEATVNGIVPDYYYFQNPSYLYMGDRVICYLEVDNMDVNSIYLPMTAEDNDDSSDWWEVELNIQF